MHGLNELNEWMDEWMNERIFVWKMITYMHAVYECMIENLLCAILFAVQVNNLTYNQMHEKWNNKFQFLRSTFYLGNTFCICNCLIVK